jgi:acyl-CoA synthetase (AMP-forming)/AMP-acid ligase II
MDLLSNLPERIHRILDEGAQRGKWRIAITDESGVDWSYARIISAVEQVAIEMSDLGVRPGDRVMIVCENSIAAIVLMYAASRLDAWAVMTNARLSARELALIIEDSQPRRIFYTSVVSPDANSHAMQNGAAPIDFSGIGVVKVGEANKGAVPEKVFQDPAKQVAVLIYTTGTTGRPKGVMLSHRNLSFVAARGKRTNTIFADDVAWCIMPISHSYGLVLLQGMLFAGARLKIMPRFDIEKTLGAVASGEVTILNAVPALLGRAIAFIEQNNLVMRPNRLRYAYSGTAPLDLLLREKAEQIFGVVLHNGYGLTETSPTISRTVYEKGSGEINIGCAIPGVTIKVVGVDGGEVAEGATGELLVKGPNVMLGYYRQPELTSEVIDAEGFLRTGDLVSLNASGEIAIQGRSKELIIRSGFNVYPQEVESALNAHPAVVNTAVVGFPAEGNEDIVAFVELVPGLSVEPEELATFIETALARYKRPQRIIVLPQLPMAPNGKIRKHELRNYSDL